MRTTVEFDLTKATDDDLALAKWIRDYDDPGSGLTYEQEQELTRQDYLWVINCCKAMIANGKLTVKDGRVVLVP
jgi:hypothetical protein